MNRPGWEDRRGMFQKGREVHEPSKPRRMSESSITDVLTRTVSGGSSSDATTKQPASPTAAKMPFGTTAAGASPTSPTAAQRRRSSAASQAGMFSNLTSLKRGSQDYSERRSSIDEMSAKSGMLSGLWASTFRGAPSRPKDTSAEPKRGVME